MSDTARDYQKTTSPDTNGLDDLFENPQLDLSNGSHFDSRCESMSPDLVLTAAEASTYLKIPISTIYRRIKAGRFSTLEGADGTVRIILPPKIENENQPIPTFVSNDNQKVEVILSDSRDYLPENQMRTAGSVDRLLTVIDEKDKKLEAATYRIGWLESQLQEREKEVKLLTDSQHKPGWWAKFSTWFFKIQ